MTTPCLQSSAMTIAPRSSAATLPGEILSPSQCATYLSCPARWYYRYGAGLPDPATGSLVRGKAVHSVIAYAMASKMTGYTVEPDAVSDIFPAAWDAAAEGAEFQPYDNVEALQASGAALAAKYLAEAAPAIEPAAVELPVMGVIGGIPVRGIIDLLDTSGRVIDLKTKSRKPSGIEPDHALQLATYVYLLDAESRKESAGCDRGVSRELTSMGPRFSDD